MKKIFQCLVVSVLLGGFAMSSLAETHSHHHEKEKKEASAVVNKDAKQSVDLNTATVEQLSELKGIGPKRAQEIVAYRDVHGKFTNVNDLSKVKGFSGKRLERLLKENPDLIEVR